MNSWDRTAITNRIHRYLSELHGIIASPEHYDPKEGELAEDAYSYNYETGDYFDDDGVCVTDQITDMTGEHFISWTGGVVARVTEESTRLGFIYNGVNVTIDSDLEVMIGEQDCVRVSKIINDGIGLFEAMAECV